MDGPTALRATISTAPEKKKKKRPKKGGKYRGAVNPALRALLASDEYRNMVSLLQRTQEQGALDSFLAKAETYWMEINIFQLALEEQQGGGRAIINTLRRDWGRIWPEELESERMDAFATMTSFWGRLDRSKIMDKVMAEILPDSTKAYNELVDSKDQKKLAAMTDDERRTEIMSRLGKSELVQQFAILSQNDPEIQSISSKMTPFVAKMVATLERKVAAQTENLGKTVDTGLIVAAVVVLLIILLATGVVKLPF